MLYPLILPLAALLLAGPIAAQAPRPPVNRGAGDISFVAAHVAGALDGLGAGGGGDHSPEEIVSLNSLVPQTQRAAVLIARLARERAAAAHTQESR